MDIREKKLYPQIQGVTDSQTKSTTTRSEAVRQTWIDYV
jgi:hypothetical protein